MARNRTVGRKMVYDSSADEEPMDLDATETPSNVSTGVVPNGSQNHSNSNVGTSSRDKVQPERSDPETKTASPAKGPEPPEAPAKKPVLQKRKQPEGNRQPAKRGSKQAEPPPKRSPTVKLAAAVVSKIAKGAVKVGRVTKNLKRGVRKHLSNSAIRMRGTGSLNPPGSKVCRACKAKERKTNFKFPTKMYHRLLRYYTKDKKK